MIRIPWSVLIGWLFAAMSLLTGLAGTNNVYAQLPYNCIWEAASGKFINEIYPSWNLMNTATPEIPTFVSDTLLISTDVSSEYQYYSQEGPALRKPDTLIIETRLRIISGETTNIHRGIVSVAFGVWPPDTMNVLQIDKDRVFLWESPGIKGTEALVDTDDDYHTYMIKVAPNGTINVFWDDSLILTGNTVYYAGWCPHKTVGWGDLSGSAYGESKWLYFKHNALGRETGVFSDFNDLDTCSLNAYGLWRNNLWDMRLDNGRLRISKPAGGTYIKGAGLSTGNCELHGDVDIRVRYWLHDYAYGDQAQINIHKSDADGGEFLFDVQRGVVTTPYPGDYFGVSPTLGLCGKTATSDTTGYLRFTRKGSTFTAWKRSIGGNWVQLCSQTLSSGPLSTGILGQNNNATPAFDLSYDSLFFIADSMVWVTPDADHDGITDWCDSYISVSNLNNAGDGSLRAAINLANSTPGLDTITFDVSGPIALIVPLPALIDDSTVILGSSAPGGARSVLLYGGNISGGGDGLVVQSRDNVIEGLAISDFPGNGISVSGALSIRNRLTKNLIYNNNGLAIDLGADGVTANDVGDGDTGPNDLLNHPVSDTMYDGMNGKFYLMGHADDSAIVEFYVAHPAGQDAIPEDSSGHGEAYMYIGADTCGSDGVFDYAISNSFGNFSRVSMIAIDTLGNTSEFSENYTLVPAPLIVVAYSPVNIILTDPNGLRFGKDSLGNDITDIFDGHYFITPNDSVVIDHPIEGTYIVQFVSEVGIPIGSTYSAIIQIDGTQQLIIAADKLCPASGKVDTSTYMVEEGFHYKNGDGNRDNTLNVGDAIFVVNYIFKGGPAPDPYLSADANCDRTVNIGDAVYVINYIFKGGHSPCHFEP